MRVMFGAAARRVQRASLRELVWVVAGNGVSLVLTAVGVKVLTTQLGEVEYGRLALGMTVPQIVSQTLFGPLTSAVMRFLPAYRTSARLPDLLATAYQAIRWLTLVLAVGGGIAAIVIGAVVDASWGWLVAACSLFAVFQGITLMLNSLQAAIRERAGVAVHQTLIALTRVGFGGGATLLVARSAVAAATGLALGMGAVLVSQASSFRTAVGVVARPGRGSRDIAVQLWGYGRHFLLFGTFASIQLSSDVWSLKLFRDERTVGIYALAFLIASGTIVLAGSVLSQFVFPMAFDRAGIGDDPLRLRDAVRVVDRASGAMALITAAAVATSVVVAGPLVTFLSTPDYRAAATVLPWLMLGLGLSQIASLLALIPMAATRMGPYSGLRIALSVVSVGLNIVGAALAGAEGVGMGLVVSGCLSVLAVVLLNRRLVPHRM